MHCDNNNVSCALLVHDANLDFALRQQCLNVLNDFEDYFKDMQQI